MVIYEKSLSFHHLHSAFPIPFLFLFSPVLDKPQSCRLSSFRLCPPPLLRRSLGLWLLSPLHFMRCSKIRSVSLLLSPVSWITPLSEEPHQPNSDPGCVSLESSQETPTLYPTANIRIFMHYWNSCGRSSCNRLSLLTRRVQAFRSLSICFFSLPFYWGPILNIPIASLPIWLAVSLSFRLADGERSLCIWLSH